MTIVNPTTLQNEELIELLFTEADRLVRPVADEVIRRGPEVMPMLSDIMIDKFSWLLEPPEWWAPIHATYLVGSIGGEDSLEPLMAALRWSDAYDNEWVTEDLPSILGSLGPTSYEELLSVAFDRSAGWSARSIAMDALGSQALRNPKLEEDIMSALGGILRDKKDDLGAKRSAAFILLDFRRHDFKDELIGFAKSEENRASTYPDYKVAFSVDDVIAETSSTRAGMELYVHDWMTFYSPEEISRRQQKWSEDKGNDKFAKIHMSSKGLDLIGRNDPCPCGSQKPYKKCCWRKLH